MNETPPRIVQAGERRLKPSDSFETRTEMFEMKKLAHANRSSILRLNAALENLKHDFNHFKTQLENYNQKGEENERENSANLDNR